MKRNELIKKAYEIFCPSQNSGLVRAVALQIFIDDVRFRNLPVNEAIHVLKSQNQINTRLFETEQLLIFYFRNHASITRRRLNQISRKMDIIDHTTKKIRSNTNLLITAAVSALIGLATSFAVTWWAGGFGKAPRPLPPAILPDSQRREENPELIWTSLGIDPPKHPWKPRLIRKHHSIISPQRPKTIWLEKKSLNRNLRFDRIAA